MRQRQRIFVQSDICENSKAECIFPFLRKITVRIPLTKKYSFPTPSRLITNPMHILESTVQLFMNYGER